MKSRTIGSGSSMDTTTRTQRQGCSGSSRGKEQQCLGCRCGRQLGGCTTEAAIVTGKRRRHRVWAGWRIRHRMWAGLRSRRCIGGLTIKKEVYM